MKQCFGYVRVSTVKQGEGVSLAAQREAISAFAKREGMIISAWFEEKETAAKTGRAVFNTMVRELERGRADGMIIHRIDRSARNLKDWALIGELSDRGIDVFFATESLDFRSRGGRLTADIQAVIAADYIRNLSLESRKGINGRLKQGLCPWMAPIGYLDHGGGQVKTLDPIRAPLVRELFDRYLTGDYSIRSLHQTMVERGLTNRRGRAISKHTVERVLQNSFYCGIIHNGRSGESFAGIHEPLITVAEFDRITAIKSGRYEKKTTRHKHLLRRLFTCAQCGRILTPERQKGRVYYRCHTQGCKSRTVREDTLDRAILDGLLQCQLSDADQAKIDREYAAWDVGSGLQKGLRSVELRIDAARGRLERLTDLLLDRAIERTAHDTKREQLLMEVRRLEDERAELADREASEADRQKFLELMKSLAALYISANSAEKRILVENCFSNRTWDGKRVRLEPSDLIEIARSGPAVLYCGEFRDTYRTLLRAFGSSKQQNDSNGGLLRKGSNQKDDFNFPT